MNSKLAESVALRMARSASALVACIAVTAMGGWILGITTLSSLLPGAGRMAPSSAVCLIVAALAIVCGASTSSSPQSIMRRRLSIAGGGAIALIGALKLVEYASGTGFGVDLLFRGAPQFVQMAPATAANFLISGTAILLACLGLATLSQALSLVGGLVAWLVLSHYLYRGDALLPLAQMATITSLAFFILDTGIVCMRPDGGLMRLLTKKSPGGMIARRMVPAALLAPILLGWMSLLAQRAGWFGVEGGISLLALSNTLVFGALIWRNAALLHQSERQRREAESGIHSQLERLHLLNQVTRAIASRQDQQSIFQAAIGRLDDHLPMEFCCVLDLVEKAEQAEVVSVAPGSIGLAARMELSPGKRLNVKEDGLDACVRGELLCVPDVEKLSSPFAKRLTRAGLHSLAAAPLIVEDEVFGLLIAARRTPNALSEGDCEFLRQLSEHVALATRQAQLYGALKQAYNDLKTTQQTVMQQERLRALGQMASGVAHDINNAVSPVALYTEMLLESEPNLSERTREYLEITRRAIGDVTHTVSRMGEFYRQRHTSLQLEPTDLNAICQQVLDLTRVRWSDMSQERGTVIDVEADLYPGLPRVDSIPSEMREALTNLIFNAVDAMPTGGRLTVRTGRKPGPEPKKIFVEVTDSGIGMSEETRQRCLEPFFTTKGERGTGLGLAMVHGIAGRNSAELQIDSVLGKGTTIRLVFPTATAIDQVKAVPQDSVTPAQRILLVDDDPLLVQSMRDALVDDGHTVVVAHGGQEGIARFELSEGQGTPFAVVITDLGMPYVDGRKVAAAVKAMSPNTPVIMLTGWGHRLRVEGDVPPHVDCLLNKPPTRSDLREALSRLMSPAAV